MGALLLWFMLVLGVVGLSWYLFVLLLLSGLTRHFDLLFVVVLIMVADGFVGVALVGWLVV